MRATTILTKLLAIEQTQVVDVTLTERGLLADVKPTTRLPRCTGCGRKVRGTYDRRERKWRHLDLAGIPFTLRYEVRRVNCPRCGILVEEVPWAATSSWFTYDFEDQVAYHAQRTDRTTVSRLMGIAWETVGSIVTRVMARRERGDRLDGLRRIGVDELSYRRHHKYVTVIVDHDRGEVVWASEGKNAETLKAFFTELGPERAALLEAVTIDMSQAYIKAVTEASTEARIIFDRFHVQRLAHDAIDEVRRDEMRRAQRGAAKTALKKTRWPLLKNPWNLTLGERAKLIDIERNNRRLYRAYMLKEGLALILDQSSVAVARTKLDEWLAWAARSKLKPFVRLARTIRSYADGILAYVETGLSNGRSEGINGKARVLTRRSFGFHSAAALIAMLFLCCSGLTLSPVRKQLLQPTKPL
jgi:transposase